jgi:hypothetical protein
MVRDRNPTGVREIFIFITTFMTVHYLRKLDDVLSQK